MSIFVLIILTFCFSPCKGQLYIPTIVPTKFIDNLRAYDYTQNNVTILEEFEDFIKPDSLVGSKSHNQYDTRIINPMFVNLDEDSTDEVICLFGWSEDSPTLAVFKSLYNSWYLIYTEPFYIYYSSPELQVANTYSINKTFYIRWLYDRGSGIYRDSYHFYKLIDNKVYHCLELVNEARILGWGIYLNQEVSTTFKFNCANADELWVVYDYNFFPGAVTATDAPWDVHPELSFVKGESGINYEWNATKKSYIPYFYNRPEELNQEKIECFRTFGNDSLFTKAFAFEIEQTLEKGTDEQKHFLKQYLEIVNKEGKATSPTGKLEDKGQVGGLKIYGIEKKE